MYCTYPIEQLFFGIFVGALTSWVGASFYFSRPLKIFSKSKSDTITFMVPNVPGKSVAIFHVPTCSITKIRETLRPEEEHYYNSEGEEFNLHESLEESTSSGEKVDTLAPETQKTLFDYDNLYRQDPDKSAAFFTKGGKYATMKDLEEAQKEHHRSEALERNVKIVPLKTNGEIYFEFIENEKKSCGIGSLIEETPSKEILVKHGNSCNDPIAFPVSKENEQFILGQIKAAHKNFKTSKEFVLTKLEELAIIIEFTDIVGMTLSEASALVATKGYEIQVLYKGIGSKTPALSYSKNLIGVRISGNTSKITEIIDVGGVDSTNKGVVNL